MRGVAAGLVLCVLVLGQAPAAGAEEPSLEIDGDGQLVLHSLPPVLDDDAVRPHLTRGLTTTFLFQVDPEGLRVRKKKHLAGARIEIRYELWDEVFHVAAGTADGRIVHRTLDSLGELASWWEGLRLVVAGRELLHGVRAPPPHRAEVSLDVVPFSKAEQRDTQRWFSEALDDAASSAADEVAESADPSPDTLERTFHLLMATSIQRQALASFRWTLPIS